MTDAIKDQLFFKDKGFDAYIIDHKHHNHTLYRVRIGTFTDKIFAKDLQKRINKYRGNTWLTNIGK